MQESHLYEYAVMRIMPRVEREEFLNTGVVLYCAKLKFLRAMCTVDHNRLLALCSKIDLDAVEANCKAYQRICAGAADAGPIGKMDMASRFRWLTAIRSTVLQSSKVHPGFCVDAEQTLSKLFNQLVLQ